MSGARFLKKAFIWILVVLAALVFLFPFLFLLLNSLRQKFDIISNPLSFSGGLSFDNYKEAYDRMNFLTSFSNSVLVTVFSLLIVMFFSSMLAFYIARYQSKGISFLFFALIASMIIPFQAIMIPFISIYGNIHLLNSRAALVYFYLGFALSLTTFMYHGFIKKLSISLEESATLEGASMFRIFWSIVFPQLKPITATTCVLNAMWFWNDYLLPSLVLFKNSRTLPLSTYTFFGTYTNDYGVAMAGLVLSIIPIIVFYLFMQKYIVTGITDGAVK